MLEFLIIDNPELLRSRPHSAQHYQCDYAQFVSIQDALAACSAIASNTTTITVTVNGHGVPIRSSTKDTSSMANEACNGPTSTSANRGKVP